MKDSQVAKNNEQSSTYVQLQMPISSGSIKNMPDITWASSLDRHYVVPSGGRHVYVNNWPCQGDKVDFRTARSL